MAFTLDGSLCRRALALAGVLVLGACPPTTPEPKTCGGHADCPDQKCVDGTCTDCSRGSEEGCVCGDGDACSTGLRCAAGRCEVCPAGELGCACPTGGTCGTGLRCNASSVCEACPAGESGCACGTGGTCGTGLRCSTSNVCEGCPAGESGCACGTGGTCGTGLRCNGSSVCETCPAGESGCACGTDGACGTGLRCNASTVCETCPVSTNGCACGTGGTCGEGLECATGTCRPTSCVDGTVSCPCRSSGNPCDNGLYCGAGDTCLACNNGVTGCPCVGGACSNSLVCDGVTTTCRVAKVCADLGCVLHQRCQESTPGADALCLAECEQGWQWNAGTTACDLVPDPTCTPEVPGSILTTCDGQNRLCVTAGGVRCGDCKDGFMEDAGACRAVDTCEVLGSTCSGSNRTCVEATAHADATCGACVDYYTDEGNPLQDCRAVEVCTNLQDTCDGLNRVCVDATTHADAACGTCVARFQEATPPAEACEPVPATYCEPTAEGSIAAICDAAHRRCEEAQEGAAACTTCVEGYYEEDGACVEPRSCAAAGCAALGRTCEGEPLASCGACLPGLVPTDAGNPQSVCRTARTCRDITCDADQICLEGSDGRDAQCSPWPCRTGADPDLGRAQNPSTGQCVDCSSLAASCGDPGESGRLSPYTLANGRCLCETLPGYYADVSTAITSRPCDADGDGWVRSSARAFVENADPVIRTNARCNVRWVDRFALENDYRQRQEVLVCQEGLLKSTGGNTCVTSKPVALYESQRNDDQIALDGSSLPWYQWMNRGRSLRASELNPLTKACITENADHNDNGTADVNEWSGTTAAGDTQVFNAFAYFVETHRGYYEAPYPGVLYGRYVVAERSRCSESFPLVYGAGEGDYWKGCARSRDYAYDRSTGNPLIGFDFSQWNCNAATGSCPVLDPPTPTRPGSSIPAHGLCDGITLPPADSAWRGMNHHSQFRCAVIDAELPANPATSPQVVATTQLKSTANTGGPLQFNRCYVACPSGDDRCINDCNTSPCATSTEPPAAGPNPSSAKLTCSAASGETVTTDDVGFVSVRYLRTAAYQRGCIDEWKEWPELCPGFLDNPTGTVGDGNVQDFGDLICGCNQNYGGPECDIGCPDSMLHFSDGYNAQTRQGWWMCATFSATAGGPLQETPEGTGYVLNGEIPWHVVPTAPMCQNANCVGGYVLR